MPTNSRRRTRGASACPPPLARVAEPLLRLLPEALTADGTPRIALALPGSTVPVIFANTTAALAAVQAWRAAR